MNNSKLYSSKIKTETIKFWKNKLKLNEYQSKKIESVNMINVVCCWSIGIRLSTFVLIFICYLVSKIYNS